LKTAGIIFLGLSLAGCGTSGPFIANEDSAAGRIEDLLRPGQRQAVREAMHDAKCRGYGFKIGTEGYGNCRLQLEQIRAMERSGRLRFRDTSTRATFGNAQATYGNKVYDVTECVGPVIMGGLQGLYSSQ